jgi:hypothetical protein
MSITLFRIFSTNLSIEGSSLQRKPQPPERFVEPSAITRTQGQQYGKLGCRITVTCTSSYHAAISSQVDQFRNIPNKACFLLPSLDCSCRHSSLILQAAFCAFKVGCMHSCFRDAVAAILKRLAAGTFPNSPACAKSYRYIAWVFGECWLPCDGIGKRRAYQEIVTAGNVSLRRR